MARVGRLAGAILAQTGDEYYLVGELKEPCDFAAAGFDPPAEGEGKRWRRLTHRRRVAIPRPCLVLELEGERLAQLLAACFVIERNGSVSERLWRLILPLELQDNQTEVNARWLAEMPSSVWQIVRDAVLRCS